MLRKFGFILAVLLFGALMFLAGAMAPEPLRAHLAEQSRQALTQVPGLSGLQGKEAGQRNGASNGSADTTETEAATDDGDEAPPPRFRELIQRPFPADATLALMIAMESSSEAAASASQAAQAAGYTTQQLQVRDNRDRQWTLVAAGEFENEKQARAAQWLMADDLDLKNTLEILALPQKDDS